MTSKEAFKELKENAQEICEWELDRLKIIEKDLSKKLETPVQVQFIDNNAKNFKIFFGGISLNYV